VPTAPDTIAASRRLLLEAIGDEPDLTLVRAGGNLGDELIRAGTHRLLAHLPVREIALDELPAATGHTVMLPGSGAWCRPYHEWTSRALAIAELRFQQVIVLPSSFDPGEDSVRHGLGSTRATVFARESESLARIQPLCDARLAHDCAFFFDFSPYARPGAGTLNAFRTDVEALEQELPPGNHDISRGAASLEEWLEAISAHAVVRTDRAHVMIAAALMGKTVQAAASRYHKIPALAATWLHDFPVELIPSGVRTPPPRAPPRAAPDPRSRVTAVVVSRDRPDCLERTVRSVARSPAVGRILVIDSNSDPAYRPRFAGLATEDARTVVHRSERDIGRAGGRRLGVELAETDLVLLVQDDVELSDRAVEHLVAELEAWPDAAGVTPAVVKPDGALAHYGGTLTVDGEVAWFSLDSPVELPASGTTGWLPAACPLVRISVLRDVPIDERMVSGYEDADWSFRIREKGLGFRRSRDAVVIQADGGPASPPPSQLAACAQRVERLMAMARFYERHQVLLGMDLADVVPELRESDGSCDLAALRRLLQLLFFHGEDWTVMEWMNGGLGPIWKGRQSSAGERWRRRFLMRCLRLPRGLDHDLDGG
jgi:GT2 family glycosyltransferase